AHSGLCTPGAAGRLQAIGGELPPVDGLRHGVDVRPRGEPLLAEPLGAGAADRVDVAAVRPGRLRLVDVGFRRFLLTHGRSSGWSAGYRLSPRAPSRARASVSRRAQSCRLFSARMRASRQAWALFSSRLISASSVSTSVGGFDGSGSRLTPATAFGSPAWA